MTFQTNSDNDPLALDPYSPSAPAPDRADSAADPLGLDPYSPIVGHAGRPDREDRADGE